MNKQLLFLNRRLLITDKSKTETPLEDRIHPAARATTYQNIINSNGHGSGPMIMPLPDMHMKRCQRQIRLTGFVAFQGAQIERDRIINRSGNYLP